MTLLKTLFSDDYINRGGESSSRSGSLTRNTDRNGPWPRSNVTPSPGSASQSRHVLNASVGSVKRRPAKLPLRAYEDEEGYASGEHDDSHELTLIRVKVGLFGIS